MINVADPPRSKAAVDPSIAPPTVSNDAIDDMISLNESEPLTSIRSSNLFLNSAGTVSSPISDPVYIIVTENATINIVTKNIVK